MNFISLAVSTFITFYIFIAIIRILPIRKKRFWQIITISFGAGATIINYIVNLFIYISQGLELYYILEILGNTLGVIIGYVAAMMIVLDSISIFKSKRYREFERGINKKDEASVPRNVFAVICLAFSVLLLIYATISIVNYNSEILMSIIGTIIGALVLFGLAIYFYISGKPLHQKLISSNLLLYIKLPEKSLVYEQKLSKEFTIDMALGSFKDIYMLDEFGIIVTPDKKYVVKGVMITKLNPEALNGLKMNLLEPNPYQEILSNFQKYNRKKIVIDENNNIKSISTLK